MRPLSIVDVRLRLASGGVSYAGVIALLVVAVLVPLRLERFDDLFRFHSRSRPGACCSAEREGVCVGWAGRKRGKAQSRARRRKSDTTTLFACGRR